MKRKAISVAICIVMILALSVPVMAVGGFPGDSKPLPLLKNQAPVYLDGVATDLLEAVYNGNSANIDGWNKISGNGAKVDIMVNGVKVGYFVFDKKGNAPKPYADFLKIEIFDNILDLDGTAEVGLRWHCSKYYAYADLSAPGVYYIPQLMQDNGKIQSFDQVWIGTSFTPTPVVPYGTISIHKWVAGQNIMEWQVEGFTGDLDELFAGMIFKLYPVAGPGEDIDYDGDFELGTLSNFGVISFPSVEAGWYAIVEELDGIAADIFDEVDPMYIEVFEGDYDYAPGTTTTYISKAGLAIGAGLSAVVGDEPADWRDKMTGANADALFATDAEFIWDDVASTRAAYGNDGSIIAVSFDVNVDGVIDGNATLYFAADNAAIVYVNGEEVAYTAVAFDGRAVSFGDKSFQAFNGEPEAWSVVYAVDLAGYLDQGSNTVMIMAANSARFTDEYDEDGVLTYDAGPNKNYDTNGNPCGLIFALTVKTEGTVFENELKEIVDIYATASFNKVADDRNIGGDEARVPDAGEFVFELYKLNEETNNFELFGTYANDIWGQVAAENLEVGSYYFKEVAQKYYRAPALLYFDVVLEVEGNVRTRVVVWAEELEDDVELPTVVNVHKEFKLLGTLDKIPSHSHQWKWSDFEIYCLFGDNSADKKELAWNTQFIGDGFFDEIDGVAIAYKAGGTLYDAVIAVDAKTVDALRKAVPGAEVVMVDDLVTITNDDGRLAGVKDPEVGNPGFWTNDVFEDASGGGQAELLKVYQWQ